MQLISKEEIKKLKQDYMKKIKEGVVFIYPTDTIYGLGCDATKKEAVEHIRQLKQRKDDPFSVIAPSQKWIEDNCEITSEVKEWLARLPGPYTLILKLKNQNSIAENVNHKSGTIGVRIPKHWIKDLVKELGIPIVTTSANQTGKEFMTSMEDLDEGIKKGIDFVIYEGEKIGRPSQIVNLIGSETKIKKR